MEKKSCACGESIKNSPSGSKNSLGKQLTWIGLILVGWVVLYIYMEKIATWLTFTVLRFQPGTKIGESVLFFLYDTPKIFMLLTLVIFTIGIIRTYITPEKTRNMLHGKKEWVGNMIASLLGIVSPFCTCSTIPLFIGFVKAGIPLGVTFSFLISSPLIDETALVLLFGLFGLKVAGLYLISGLVISFVSGLIIGKLHLENGVQDWVYEVQEKGVEGEEEKFTISDRITFGIREIKNIVGKVWPYIVAGIAVGALIHGYVPTNLMAGIMGKKAWWSVPLAVLIGVPMYSNGAGIIPIFKVLLEKGAALGTVLAFMMAVIGLSLPEIIILKNILKWKLIAIFVGIVSIGILLVGYLFNILL
jgi:uncharacterized membrane protein YraQ (UPF0718 family)